MSKVKIVVRVRPFLAREVIDDAVSSDGVAISLRDSRNSAQRLIYKEFSACYDYASATNGPPNDLFKVEIEPLLGSVYEGKTLAVLCYGVTSSGKTTTMQGNEQVPGIVARSIEKVLQGPGGSTEDHQYSMQYFEIYCDECYDLLVPPGTSSKLSLREGTDGRVTVANLSCHQFSNTEEFRSLVMKATKSRKTAATASNRASSRSHAILRVTVFQVPPRRLSHTHLPRILGRIEFVDLAGSERNKSAVEIGPAPKTCMTESISINKSLTALSRVIVALNNGSGVIPYRDSLLTRVLKDTFGGKSTTLLVCNIAPGAKWLSHTRATIEFATKAKAIKLVPRPLGNDESKRRVEQKRYEDAEFNLAVEAEVARRLAALNGSTVPASTKGPVILSHADSKASPRLDPKPQVTEEPAPLCAPTDVEEPPLEPTEPLCNNDYQDNYDGGLPPSYDEPPEVLDITEDLTTTDQGKEQLPEATVDDPSVPSRKPSHSKGKKSSKNINRVELGPSRSRSAVTAPKELDENQDDEEEKQRYRRNLTKGLKQKHEKYSSSGQPIDRYKFARACIIAGKLALSEKDDVELAISMFEKAISWYPENERLLEETLKLKRRLRGETDDTQTSKSSIQVSVFYGKTLTKQGMTPNLLVSTRKGNSRDDKGTRRPIFQFDVDKEEVIQQEKEQGTKSRDLGKGKKRSRSEDVDKSSVKGKNRGKGRAVLEAAAAAFADSEVEVEEVDNREGHLQNSEAEVEKSLEDEYSDHVASPSPVKAKSRRKGHKRKSGDSDEEFHPEQEAPKELPTKKRRIIF